MKITKRYLRQIIKEEAEKLRDLSRGGVQSGYAGGTDIAAAIRRQNQERAGRERRAPKIEPKKKFELCDIFRLLIEGIYLYDKTRYGERLWKRTGPKLPDGTRSWGRNVYEPGPIPKNLGFRMMYPTWLVQRAKKAGAQLIWAIIKTSFGDSEEYDQMPLEIKKFISKKKWSLVGAALIAFIESKLKKGIIPAIGQIDLIITALQVDECEGMLMAWATSISGIFPNKRRPIGGKAYRKQTGRPVKFKIRHRPGFKYKSDPDSPQNRL